jgi:hypothetical protein
MVAARSRVSGVRSGVGPSLPRQNVQPSQAEIVTLAVFLLGGDQHVVDTEDVAVRASQLAPGRFSWRKHADQINLELIRVFLSDAKKRSNGALLAGSGRTGWTLTAAGQGWVQRRGQAFLGSDLRRARKDKRVDSVTEGRWRRERTRILASPAWQKWNSERVTVSTREAEDVFRIDAYAQGRIRDLKIGRLREMFLDDAELNEFVQAMARMVARDRKEESQ